MKHLFFLLLTLTLALSLTSIAVAAESAETVSPPVVAEAPLDGAAPDTLNAPPSDSTDTALENPPADPAESPLPADPDTDPVDEREDRTFGEVVNYIWDTYAGEIFSALTLLTSLVLAYFYKRGLVPVVWNGLDRINRASTAASDAARSLAVSTDEKLSAFTERVEPVLTDIDAAAKSTAALTDYIRTLEARISEAEEDRALVRAIMAGVADMLYGVFTAANLPAYAKEQIGTRYTAIAALLKDKEGSDEQKAAAV